MRDISKWDVPESSNLKPIELDVLSDASIESAVKKILKEDGNMLA